ncbi:hypothetical protein [Clostridium estertheticum]|uniref:hypothetical protein n=1 Tax=Clostridium estertheticum TaxID=238834 RepID=UPI001C7DB8DF|nr:hypothetical protein [Clostridium estertheticum]MBX4272232.1 hypothetical protein [Clostridium estertheticum]WLC78213.1 hypothetical protein KTC98_13310 [Clostridium estertheticum]WLC79784.1 hypothetical protein KTC98_22025 [Clostridium estertheticum]
MFDKIKRISKKNIILSIGIILCLCIVSSYAYTKFTPQWFSSADTYNVVKEGFLTNKGYSNELSKHMSEQVFKRINIYQYEDLNKKRTYKIDFTLKEDSRRYKKGVVYVKMIYTLKIMDLQNIQIGPKSGSHGITNTFTVKNINGVWYIADNQEDIKS